MKSFTRILLIGAAIILLAGYMLPANAAEAVGFNAGNTSVKNNRIFSIPVSGKGNEILSAVKFVFEYDGNSIKYRKINVTDQNTIVKEVEEKGKLSLIFLNEKGVDLSTVPQLFTIDFKAENMSKNQEIKFSVLDCVNSKVENINASGGKCSVTYLGNAEDDENSSNGRTGRSSSNGNADSEDGDLNNSYGDNDSQNYGDGDNTNQQNNKYDENGNLLEVDEKDNTLKVFLSGAIIVIVLGVIGGILYNLGKKLKEKENSGKKESGDKIESSDEIENSAKEIGDEK